MGRRETKRGLQERVKRREKEEDRESEREEKVLFV